LSSREAARFGIFILGQSGCKQTEIAALFHIHTDTVSRWIKRQDGTPDCFELERRHDRVYTRKDEERIIAFYCQTTMLPSGHGRWSLRSAEQFLHKNPDEIGISPSRSTIQRILSGNMIKPHRNKYFLHITDPDFFPKMEHLIELKNNAPEHLYYFDESPGIQVLQRLSPSVLAGKSENRIQAWLKEFEYIRNGTVDLFAFLNAATGHIQTECRADHTKDTFMQVFRAHAGRLPEGGELHYVMDNLATHTTYEFCLLVAELSHVPCPSRLKRGSVEDRRNWLQSEGKRIVIHFTPFHGSWLNSAEVVFSILSRTILKESYSHPDELKLAIEEFSQWWDQEYARPWKWDYTGEGLQQKVIERLTAFLDRPETEWHNRFMNKQFKLASNLINDYWNNVDNKAWSNFFTKLSSAQQRMTKRINHDPKPKRKKETLASFKTLLTAAKKAQKKVKRRMSIKEPEESKSRTAA